MAYISMPEAKMKTTVVLVPQKDENNVLAMFGE